MCASFSLLCFSSIISQRSPWSELCHWGMACGVGPQCRCSSVKMSKIHGIVIDPFWIALRTVTPRPRVQLSACFACGLLLAAACVVIACAQGRPIKSVARNAAGAERTFVHCVLIRWRHGFAHCAKVSVVSSTETQRRCKRRRRWTFCFRRSRKQKQRSRATDAVSIAGRRRRSASIS